MVTLFCFVFLGKRFGHVGGQYVLGQLQLEDAMFQQLGTEFGLSEDEVNFKN